MDLKHSPDPSFANVFFSSKKNNNNNDSSRVSLRFESKFDDSLIDVAYQVDSIKLIVSTQSNDIRPN